MTLTTPLPFTFLRTLARGGLVAYPTEGVYGIGCLPDAHKALHRILDVKGRDADKGLILIAAATNQLLPWIDIEALGGYAQLSKAVSAVTGERAHTFIVPAADRCHPLLTGGRSTIAVRVTRFPTAAAICSQAGSAIVSTSANESGKPAIQRPLLLQKTFGHTLDAICHRKPGHQRGVSRIIELSTGRVLRE
ncbi:MAG: L-threonylcarbamoyladenylate synthase [Woeseiaceae bacterium]